MSREHCAQNRNAQPKLAQWNRTLDPLQLAIAYTYPQRYVQEELLPRIVLLRTQTQEITLQTPSQSPLQSAQRPPNADSAQPLPYEQRVHPDVES